MKKAKMWMALALGVVVAAPVMAAGEGADVMLLTDGANEPESLAVVAEGNGDPVVVGAEDLTAPNAEDPAVDALLKGALVGNEEMEDSNTPLADLTNQPQS